MADVGTIVDPGSTPPQQTQAQQQSAQGRIVDPSDSGNGFIHDPTPPPKVPSTATPIPQPTQQAKQQAKINEQTHTVPQVLNDTAKLSPNKPAIHNPLREQAGQISENIGQKIGQNIGKGLASWDQLAQAVGHKAQQAVVGTEQAMWQGSIHAVENTNNFLNAAGRGGLQVANDITGAMDADKKQMPGNDTYEGKLLDRPVMDTAGSIIKSVGDYVWHSPKNMNRVLSSIQDTRQTQILTDALEHHFASLTNLPDPNHFPKVAKIITDTIVQGGVNPASYVSIGGAWKFLSGMGKMAVDTKMGASVVDAMGHAAGLPELTLAAKQMHGAMDTAVQNTQKAFQFATRIRPDLDKHWTDPGKMVVMGIQNAADHVSLEWEKAHTALIDKLAPVMDNMKVWDAPPKEMQNQIYREMFMFGTENDAKYAEQVGRLQGWRPDDAAKAARAQGLFDFNRNAKGLGMFMSWVPPKGASEAETRSLAWWKNNTGAVDLADVYKNGGHAENMLETMSAKDLAKFTNTSMTDLMKNRFTLLRSMARRSLIAKNLSQAVYEDPSLMHTDVRGMFDAAAAGDEEGEGAQTGEWVENQMRDWMQKNVEDRQPSLQIGGKIGFGDKSVRVQDVLTKTSALWKSSLLGNILPHGLRNVGIVTLLRGGVKVAANGLKMAVTGVPKQLQDEMKGAGAWTEFWRETPEILKNLMVRSGVGAGIGAASGAMKPTDSNDPMGHLRQIGEGAVLGGAFGAAMPKMGRLMDRFENSYRASYFQELKKQVLNAATSAGEKVQQNVRKLYDDVYMSHADPNTPRDTHNYSHRDGNDVGAARTMGDNDYGQPKTYEEFAKSFAKPKTELTANDLFQIGAKVANDLGGYQHTSQLVKILQGVGGTFMAYRGSTVPRAFIHGVIHKTGLVGNALQAENNASGLLPTNSGSHNPVDFKAHERVLGAIDEAPRLLGDPGPSAGSAASIGPMIHTVGKQMFGDTTEPVGVKEMTYDALNLIEGGSAAQTMSPWLDPYPNKSGMPLWGQEINRAFGGYVDQPSYAKEKLTGKHFRKAANQ